MSEVPPHIKETADTIAALRDEHDLKASQSERLLTKIAALFAAPPFLGFVSVLVVAWLLLNVTLYLRHAHPIDPPPFSFLQGALTLFAVYVSLSILSAQRRANDLADLRAQVTLEHAILAEQKAAKAIALLEELRKDDPLIKDRADPEAQILSGTVETGKVAAAIKEAHKPADQENKA